MEIEYERLGREEKEIVKMLVSDAIRKAETSLYYGGWDLDINKKAREVWGRPLYNVWLTPFEIQIQNIPEYGVDLIVKIQNWEEIYGLLREANDLREKLEAIWLQLMEKTEKISELDS